MGCGASSDGAVKPDRYGPQQGQYGGYQQGYQQGYAGQQGYPGQQPYVQPAYHQQVQNGYSQYPPQAQPSPAPGPAIDMKSADLAINKPLEVQSWLETQVQGAEEDQLWKELKAAGLNTWASINKAYPSDSVESIEAVKKAVPSLSKGQLAQGLLAKAALEVRAAGFNSDSSRAGTTTGYPQQPGGYPQMGAPGYPQQGAYPAPGYSPYPGGAYPGAYPMQQPYGGGFPQQQQQQQQGRFGGGGMGMAGGLALGAGAGLLGGAMLGSAFGGGGHDTTIINNYDQPGGGDYGGGGGDWGGGGGDWGGGGMDFGGGDFGGGGW